MKPTLYVTSDAFRIKHPFCLLDGRRFASLASASHSLMISGPKGSAITEETKIGEKTWSRRTISYEVARLAFEQGEKAAASAALQHPAILRGDGVTAG